jgi:hypothetical protein
MSSRLLSCLFAATALLTVGCDDSTGIDDDDAANVRIVNASPIVGDLDVAVNGNTQADASEVAFLNAGQQCVRVNATDPQYEIEQPTAGVTAIPTQNFTFTEGGRNTVVVAGTAAGNLRVINLDDPVAELDAGEARVRVVNGFATQSIDVFVTPWNQTLGSATNITATNTAAAATTWVDVPAGPVAIRLENVGSNTARDILNIFLTAGQELTLVAVEPATTGGPIRWVSANACSEP